MSETSLVVTPTIAALNLLPGVVVWRNQSGSARVKRGYLHLAPKGTPDIVGYKMGRFIGIECKMPKAGKPYEPSPEQTMWLEKAKEAGCIVGVVRSVDEAVKLVMAA